MTAGIHGRCNLHRPEAAISARLVRFLASIVLQLPINYFSLQDAEGNNLCQYREFEPSAQGDTDEEEEQWHGQKKGCCIIM